MEQEPVCCLSSRGARTVPIGCHAALDIGSRELEDFGKCAVVSSLGMIVSLGDSDVVQIDASRFYSGQGISAHVGFKNIYELPSK